jgi:hypothetical protein
MESSKKTISNPLVRLALFIVLALSARFSFLRYLYWSFAYNGVLGMPSRLEQAQHAYHRARFFLCLFVGHEIILAIIAASCWEPPDPGSAALRFVLRYGLGSVEAVIATAMLVGVAP